MPDLNEALAYKSQAIVLTPDGHPDKPRRFGNNAIAYFTRFEHLGEVSDLNAAIAHGSQALLLTPDSHPDRQEYVSNLGAAHSTRFQRLGEINDLDQAILLGLQAISLTPDGHPPGVETLNNLGGAYTARFERLGEISNLNEAIAYGSQAVSLTPDDHPHKPAMLNNLGVTYTTRFERLGELSDLDEAITYRSQAVALTPDGHPKKPGYAISLGAAYGTRFQRLGEMSDLNQSIAYEFQAVLLTPDGHSDKPGYLSNLGGTYSIRAKRLGEMFDLNEAITYGSQAVSLTPDGHPDKSTRLSNLGAAYMTRFEHRGEMSDLNEAITYGSEAISLTSDDHPHKPGMFNNLGAAYRTRFERLGEMSDLNTAIASASQAAALIPDGDPDKPVVLNNLGVAYSSRFDRVGDISDLNKAISYESQAVSLTPDGHPNKTEHLSNLGGSYRTRYEHLASVSDQESAALAYKSAAQSSTGSPSARFSACRQWARLPSPNATLAPHSAYNLAMELLPLLAWVGFTLDRRYELLAEVGDFSVEAASHAISFGAFSLALEWLEAGRSIVWGQISQLRTPFDQLVSHDPKLANELRDVGRKLEQAGSRASSLPSAPNTGRDPRQEANSHMNLALHWETLLKQARSISGFEDFLRPPKSSRLIQAAQSHPVVLINCHRSSCDALILQPNVNTVSHVPLREFSHDIASLACGDLESLARQRGFKKVAKPGSSADRRSPLEESLKHLWLCVVNPILEYLGFTDDLPINQLPRITWCTTGVLAFLPLHAAGCYDQSKFNTFDRVISSYTPTLSALLTSQSQTSVGQCGLVSVGQENTPGFSRLPCVNKELEVIKNHAQEAIYLQLESGEATVNQVLDAMEQFSWVHMACHGTQNATDSRQSAFHLHDGPLTLADISSRSFTNKGLAFLSACQTATGDTKLPDEAIHLAAGMLMAGFPSVIGTMWSIADQDGPKVADKVYAELLKDGKMDHTKAVRALHEAVAQLRKAVGERAIEQWVPFIHIGS